MDETKPSATGRGARPMDPESVERREKLEAWQGHLVETFVANVLHYRGLRKLSNDALRGRLDQAGWRLTRDSLAGILAGKKKSVPVADVLLFAWALNVPPMALVFPLRTNGLVQTNPLRSEAISAIAASDWFSGVSFDGASGDGVEGTGDVDFDRVEDFFDVADVVQRVKNLDEAMEQFAFANAGLISSENLTGDQRKMVIKDAQASLLRIRDSRELLRSTNPGLVLPPLRTAIDGLDLRGWKMPSLPIANYNTEDELHRARALGKDY